MSKIKNETITSAYDQTQLSLLSVEPEGEIKGIIQMVHGMAEHKERYLETMEYFADHGFVCVMHDHRGHGDSVASQDDYGYFNDINGDAVVDDVALITDMLKARYPGLPLILFGHSMGSLIVRAYMKRYDDKINGLIVCGSPSKRTTLPAEKLFIQLMIKLKGERYRSAFINKLSFGAYNKRFSQEKSENAWICSDPEVVRAYDASEKCGFTFTLNGFMNVLNLMEKTYSKNYWQMKNRYVPILFIIGSDDPCAVDMEQFKASVNFMCQVGYENISNKIYPNVRHEILNDLSKNEVRSDMLAFIEQAIQK
ncbi:alpha/beta fold hydrolase [Dielma fastidiosa]|uniref:alpha/beta fold hydrolase n=1 Tax=Dielma fastidiosa TaxID=1034346 RepID=UPI000E54C12E|nr:alpha/beta fold hydrolase [Dielma fastidiosa]RHM96875.1 alpha/beta fold hydrolase [Dielma fastidiosa]